MENPEKPSQSLKPFHSRIFRLYLEYLRDRKGWKEGQIEDLLSSVNTTRSRVYDDSTWYNLNFADNFYKALVERTADKEIAFHAGLYIKKSAFSATIYYLMRGLISVGRIYELVSKFTPHFTKAAVMKVLDLRHQTALIESCPVAGMTERPYMCENRRGILQALPQVFDLPFAGIRELECVHRGGKRCLYHVQWKERSYFRYVFTSVVAAIGAFSISRLWLGLNTSILLGLGVLAGSVCMLVLKHILSQRKELELHNSVLDSAVSDIERKNRELELISQISKLTHSVTSAEDMTNTVVQSVVNLLEYDRAIFLKVIPERHVLRVVSHFGFDESLSDILTDTEFTIREDNTSGFFIKVVNTKSPVLIEDIAKEITKLSTRSQHFAKMLKATSFVAVPLKDQTGEVTGVLAVDYIEESKCMSVSDQDLLMMLADHISIADYNTQLLKDLEESLDRTKEESRIQENLKGMFQKFVPSDLVSELSMNSDKEFSERILRAVRKKWVSVLFADILGFSTISNELAAEEIVDMLNKTFSELAPLIAQHRGFIDKFTGDGFMAVFEGGESPLDACHAALHIAHALKPLREKLTSDGYPGLHMGLGIHYGPVILGNVGSPDRLNFTVIGDTVNLASRLESYTRNLGPDTICVSQQVQIQVGEKLRWKDLGEIELKGFSEKIKAYQLMTGLEYLKRDLNRHLKKV